MSTVLLPIGTSAVPSAPVALAAGEVATVFLIRTGGGQAIGRAYLEQEQPDGDWIIFDALDAPHAVLRQVYGPVNFRMRRPDGQGVAYGVGRV